MMIEHKFSSSLIQKVTHTGHIKIQTDSEGRNLSLPKQLLFILLSILSMTGLHKMLGLRTCSPACIQRKG